MVGKDEQVEQDEQDEQDEQAGKIPSGGLGQGRHDEYATTDS